jgi:hypothetical protein
MISIDFKTEVALYNNDEPDKPIKKMLPCMYDAYDFCVLPIEHRDNEDNEELNEILRNMVTSVTYAIMATVVKQGHFEDAIVKGFGTPEEAEKVYGEVMDAIARGDKLYSFRKEPIDAFEAARKAIKNMGE